MIPIERLEGVDGVSSESQTVLFPELTTVPLPRELQMADTRPVIGLLNALIEEEAAINDMYVGGIVFGSVSRGTAHGNSDIDVVHVAQTEDSLHNFVFRLRLQTIFIHLYGIHIDQGWTPLGLQELRQRTQVGENTLVNPRTNVHCLDRYSRILVPNSSIREELEGLLPFKTIDPRLFPKNRHWLNLPAILNVDLLKQPDQLPHWRVMKFLQRR